MPPAPIFHLLTIRFHLFGICWNNWTNTPGRLPLESKVGGRGILHGHLVALMMSHANYFSNSQITSIAVASFGRVLPWTSWTRLWRRYRLCRTDKPLTWSPTRLLPSVVPRNPCISVTTLTEKNPTFLQTFSTLLASSSSGVLFSRRATAISRRRKSLAAQKNWNSSNYFPGKKKPFLYSDAICGRELQLRTADKRIACNWPQKKEDNPPRMRSSVQISVVRLEWDHLIGPRLSGRPSRPPASILSGRPGLGCVWRWISIQSS